MSLCQQPPVCDPCNPVYTEVGCCDYPPTKCVIYDGEDIPCLNITHNENLNDILQHLKDVICALGPGGFGTFDYGCFASQNITTEQEFVEFISATLCEVLGTQVPGGITSLSQLYALIVGLRADVNAIKSQTVINCFQTLSGLSSPEDISILLTAIQTVICDLDSRITILEGGATNTPITVVDTNSVNLTRSGLNFHTIQADVILDPDGSNAMTVSGAGLKTVSPDVTVVDTNSINFSVSGTKGHTVTGDVKISAVAGNAASILGDGIYVADASATETPLVATDSTSIDFTTSGTNGHNITGSVILDPNLLNIATITASGLFVSSALTNTPITVVDTNSINLTASGTNNHTVQADAIISPNAGNGLSILGNGLFVDTSGFVAGWGLLGNSIISTNFLGSTNNQPLNFKVNNNKSGKIGSTGETSFGYQAGNVNLSTQFTAFGYQALKLNSTGAANVAVGSLALTANVIGASNVAVGDYALTASNTDSNTAIGSQTLQKLTVGVGNTALGCFAGTNFSLGAELVGSYNTFLGHSAMNYNGFPSISKSVAIGYNAFVNKDNTMVLGGTGVDLVSVVVGGLSADDSAVMELVSVEKGFLPPRMTTGQRTGIASPAEGLTVYDLTLHKLYVHDGTIWQACW